MIFLRAAMRSFASAAPLPVCFVTREHDLGRLNYAAQIATVARIRMFPDRIHSLTIPCVPTDLLGIDFWGVGEGIGILESQAEISILLLKRICGLIFST